MDIHNVFKDISGLAVLNSEKGNLKDMPFLWEKIRRMIPFLGKNIPEGIEVHSFTFRPSSPNENNLFSGSTTTELLTHMPVSPSDWVNPALKKLTDPDNIVEELKKKMGGGQPIIMLDGVPSTSEGMKQHYFPSPTGVTNRPTYKLDVRSGFDRTFNPKKVGEEIKNTLEVHVVGGRVRVKPKPI